MGKIALCNGNSRVFVFQGIVFTLIIVRIGLGLTNDEGLQSEPAPMAGVATSHLSTVQPIAVTMTTVVTRDHVDSLCSSESQDRKEHGHDEYKPTFTVSPLLFLMFAPESHTV